MAARNNPPPAKPGGHAAVEDRGHPEIRLRIRRWLDFESSYRVLRLLSAMLTVIMALVTLGALVMLIFRAMAWA
jgi:hypothetical protein